MNVKLNISLGVKILFYTIITIFLSFFFKNLYIGLLLISCNEVIIQIKNTNFISTFTFWCLGFIFIVCLDGIISKDFIILKTSEENYDFTSFVFLISQLIIIYFYRYFEKKSVKNILVQDFKIELREKLNGLTLVSFILLYLFFLFHEFPNALNSFFYSRFELIRNSEFGGLKNVNRSLFTTFAFFIAGFSGYILPSLFCIWFNKKFKPLLAFLLAIIPSSLIWIIYLIQGTRHHILFSLLGLIGTLSLLMKYKVKFRLSFFIVIFLGFFVSNKIVDVRRHGFFNYFFGEKIERYMKEGGIVTDKTAIYMNYVTDYYDNNTLRYGKSSLQILFFWVPRKFWPEKPTQFGYWFIREYLGNNKKGFSEKYSAPASYLGVPYSDFALLGVVFISLLIAWLSNKIDLYFRKNKTIKSYKQIVLLSFCLASFFFLPRQLSQFFSKFVIIFLVLNFIFFLNKFSVTIKNKIDFYK